MCLCIYLYIYTHTYFESFKVFQAKVKKNRILKTVFFYFFWPFLKKVNIWGVNHSQGRVAAHGGACWTCQAGSRGLDSWPQ